MPNDEVIGGDPIIADKMNSAVIGDDPPTAPFEGQRWVDTSGVGQPIVKVYDGVDWKPFGQDLNSFILYALQGSY
ncbi:MAG: hypothetical protein M0Q49_03255 [Porticoccaceae bacterium]|nr:hypothetical protein [Porticoccaceae bacterium]